jgi:protein-S-isoprenylcysteine O-methyltransferase Ste14
VVAVVCYVLALAGAAALGLRVLTLGLSLFPDQAAWPPPWPWVIDLGWLGLFGLQHSGMARTGFKRVWTRLVPPRLERSVYAGLTGLLLLGLAWTWQPVGGPIWSGPPWLVAVPLLAGLGSAVINLRFDHAGMFGLRQVWEAAPAEERLLVLGPYRYVRHPLMGCLLVLLWAHPVMTPTLALLSGGLSVYIVLGLVLEERDLRRRFGAAYAEYRRRVPAVIPWRPPPAPGTYPAVVE